MTNITKEFTYNLADDQYYQTNDNLLVGVQTYNGPSHMNLVVDSTTNKLTGATIADTEYEDYNNEEDGYYAVRVNCDTDTLMCAIMPGGTDSYATASISEDVPGSDIPYSRDNPPMPDHTYELREIQYDRPSQSWVTPMPWKKPFVTWEDKLSWRNLTLRNADRTASDDLPTALYNEVVAYKQYLRDFTETFGATFSVTVATAGTGYVVGDRMLISDPSYKNGTTAADILVTVSAVADGTGAITAITKSNTRAWDYHPLAGTYNNVYYTSSAAGSGAVFNMSKVATIDPWKITPIEHPMAPQSILNIKSKAQFYTVLFFEFRTGAHYNIPL